MEEEANSERLTLELPIESPNTTISVTVDTMQLTDTTQNISKDLGELQMEEVRIESVDLNTANTPELESDSKDKSRFSLEKILLYFKNSFLYYTSCSTKKPTNK